MLIGKAKEQFEKWYLKEYTEMVFKDGLGLTFRDLPQPMQWGVYQDWADSLDIDMFIEVEYVEKSNILFTFTWSVFHYSVGIAEEIGHCETRQEARTAAIKKLDELINSEP